MRPPDWVAADHDANLLRAALERHAECVHVGAPRSTSVLWCYVPVELAVELAVRVLSHRILPGEVFDEHDDAIISAAIQVAGSPADPRSDW